MSLIQRAVGLTLLGFMGLFAIQLLAHDRLEELRHLGRRGLLHRRSAAADGGGSTHDSHAGGIAARLNRLALGSGRHGQDGDGADAAVIGTLKPGGPGSLPDPAIIVFCFNRTDYLNVTLRSLLGLPGLERYAVYVSQDGNDQGVADLVAGLRPAFKSAARGFEFWQKHPRVPELSGTQAGHAWLAQHYRWGLGRAFDDRGHSHVVIVEDDMLFSPDFLLYFEATAPLLDADPSLWCVSSWNDNGFEKGHHWDVAKLFRTSYFPGLGWMMKRELWQELGPSWPADHWDHWMRDEEVSRGRECICPEVNRNKNIGEVGANMNKQAFKRYLKTMGWNENQTVTDYGDLSLLLKPAYEAALRRDLAEAQPWEFSYRRDAPRPEPGKTYLVPYVIERYMRPALRLKLWPYPRGHHQHVAIIPWEGSRFLVADQRFCPLLPKEQQLPPTEGMHPVAGRRWQSCTDACEEQGLVCYARDFWWLNSCAVMRKHFPCEHGCTIELGPDVPAYVPDSNQTLYKYCLITQKASTCAAKHASTARLCACVPADKLPAPQTVMRTRLQQKMLEAREKTKQAGVLELPQGTTPQGESGGQQRQQERRLLGAPGGEAQQLTAPADGDEPSALVQQHSLQRLGTADSSSRSSRGSGG